jgi:deoxyribonuclease-4
MRELLDAIPAEFAPRVGVCLDTAHVWAAGYDLINEYDSIIEQFDRVIGLARLGCLHLNDSKATLGSHLDRHNLIGEGSIGAEPFRRIMTDVRLRHVPRIIETPKGETPAENDGRMLSRLRQYATGE